MEFRGKPRSDTILEDIMKHVVLSLALVTLAGCSSAEAPTPTPSPEGTTTPATGTDTPATEPADEPTNEPPATPAAPSLKAPKIDSIMKMGGGLHVTWTNQEDTCESIVGERKTATSEYKVAFTVPGAVDNKHDGAATEATTYTYRLRCKKGTTFSAYSNEKSASPK